MVTKKDIVDAARNFITARKGTQPGNMTEEQAGWRLQRLVERYDEEVAHVEELYRKLKEEN